MTDESQTQHPIIQVRTPGGSLIHTCNTWQDANEWAEAWQSRFEGTPTLHRVDYVDD
jgi:hypothetical protein